MAVRTRLTQGTTVPRKGGLVSSRLSTRSSTPQVQSTSTTIFGGGVKDTSGRTSEYFVRNPNYSIRLTYVPIVYG